MDEKIRVCVNGLPAFYDPATNAGLDYEGVFLIGEGWKEFGVEDFLQLVEPFGATPENSRLVTDSAFGRCQGYGFVWLSPDNAAKAIGALDETSCFGMTLSVVEAGKPFQKNDELGWRFRARQT